MANNSRIEWTQKTWNPVTGCTKVSQGCKFCYAERMAKRLHAMGNRRYLNEFRVTLHDDLLEVPKLWKKPQLIFVNSMSDLFHEAVPDEFIVNVFRTIRECPQHIFQILTKRSRRLRDMASRLDWSPNLWMGVSVENLDSLKRIDDLRDIPAAIRFLSCEPLLGPLPKLDLRGIDWLIVGGESGPNARPIKESWVRDILAACRTTNTPFFFKQWGGVQKKKTGRKLGGRTYDEFPTISVGREGVAA